MHVVLLHRSFNRKTAIIYTYIYILKGSLINAWGENTIYFQVQTCSTKLSFNGFHLILLVNSLLLN